MNKDHRALIGDMLQQLGQELKQTHSKETTCTGIIVLKCSARGQVDLRGAGAMDPAVLVPALIHLLVDGFDMTPDALAHMAEQKAAYVETITRH